MQVFTLARGGCGNHKCHGRWDWGVNDVMPESDGREIFGDFLKKQLVEI